jgi:predicted nucleic acid-binding protein
MAHLVDTSVLARLANTADPFHAVAAQAVLELHRAGEVLYLTAQNLVEFRHFATPRWRLALGSMNLSSPARCFAQKRPVRREVRPEGIG